MSLVRIDFNPSRRQLAVFAVAWLVFFGAIGGAAFLRNGSPTAAAILWGVAAGVPAIGWAVPAVLRLAYIGMSCLAFPIGLVVSYVILVALYYLLFTPIGLLMRLCGYDPMCRRFDPAAPSYWVPREADDGASRCFRQF